jgi:hypothetical protein
MGFAYSTMAFSSGGMICHEMMKKDNDLKQLISAFVKPCSPYCNWLAC